MKALIKETVLLLAWLAVGLLVVPGVLWVVRGSLPAEFTGLGATTTLTAAYQEFYAARHGIMNWLWLLAPYAIFLIVRTTIAAFERREPEGYTKLGLAVFREDLDSIKSLIEDGAELGAKECDGRTPLHLAAAKNRVDIIRMLLEGGADIDATEQELGMRPLHIAASEGNTDVCEVLIRYGADIDSTNLGGDTALHNAVKHNHADVVSLLLKYRARPNMRDNNGMTPLQCAMESGYRDIAELIRQHVNDEWPYLQLSNG